MHFIDETTFFIACSSSSVMHSFSLPLSSLSSWLWYLCLASSEKLSLIFEKGTINLVGQYRPNSYSCHANWFLIILSLYSNNAICLSLQVQRATKTCLMHVNQSTPFFGSTGSMNRRKLKNKKMFWLAQVKFYSSFGKFLSHSFEIPWCILWCSSLS